MAKRKPVSTCHVVMISGSITVNGVTRDLRGVDYRRTEFADGRVEESGRPPALPENPSVGVVLAYALQGIQPNPGEANASKASQCPKRSTRPRKSSPQQ